MTPEVLAALPRRAVYRFALAGAIFSFATMASVVAGASPAAMAAAHETVYIGSGTRDGGVVVNLDVLDGETSATQPRPSQDADRTDRAGREAEPERSTREARPGEAVQGPGGTVLAFPPMEKPRSRLNAELPPQPRTAPAQEPPNPLRSASKPEEVARDLGELDAEDYAAQHAAPSSPLPNAAPTEKSERASAVVPAPVGKPIRLVPAKKPEPEAVMSQRSEDSPRDAAEAGPETRAEADAEGEAGVKVSALAEARPREAARAAAEMQAPESYDPPESEAERTATAEESREDRAGATSTDAAEAEDEEEVAEALTPAEDAPDTTAETPEKSAEPEQPTQLVGRTVQDEAAAGDLDRAAEDVEAEAEAETAARTQEPEESQTVAAPSDDPELPDRVRLSFTTDSAELSPEARTELTKVVAAMSADPRQRIQLLAFAEGTEETASRARRLSLTRALAVRAYMIDEGIRSTRIDVRALGNTAEDGPPDRVDIEPVER